MNPSPALCNKAGLSQKWAPYEEVTRVPLVISAPGRFAGGRTVGEMVQLFDLGPTILERAGLVPEGAMEAISLNPALEGEAFGGRSHVFCEQAGDANMTGASYLTMARSHTHKLVHFRGPENGQLFDLVADPGKRRNLWNDASAQHIKQELLNAMLDFHIESAVHTRNARRLIVSPQGAEALQ